MAKKYGKYFLGKSMAKKWQILFGKKYGKKMANTFWEKYFIIFFAH